jgi:hypothetical protein
MKRKILLTLAALITLPLWAFFGPATLQSTTSHEYAAAFPPFELPDNLPEVEQIYPLSQAVMARLRADGFVVLPEHDIPRLSSAYMGLFPREQVSVVVTTDVALHLFHNVFDDLLEEIERAHLTHKVQQLVLNLLDTSTAYHDAIPDTQVLGVAAARHNVLFFAVAARLLDDQFVIPDAVEPEASQYVQKILEHSVTEFYPGDDYTQYEPRGHYAGDDQLERYFRAMKWLSRRIFRIEDYIYPSDADVELTAAALLALCIADDSEIQALWNEVYDVTRQLAGPADSITPLMMRQALDNVFGPSFTLDTLEDPTNRAALRTELQLDIYPTSEVIPVPLEFPDQIPPKYVQFMGERYLPDAEAMQETCFPYVTLRTLPSGLDVMATVLASDRAEHWLADDIIVHPQLATQLDALRAQFDAYTIDDWTKSTYNGWLYSLRPLLQPMPAGVPAFMRGAAWQDKELNTALASWTQLRHDFILYGKQTYIPAPWAEGPGLVEPVPDVFGRLADLCEQVRSLLSQYGMLPSEHRHSLGQLAAKFSTWQLYAQKVADGEWLTEAEQDDIHQTGIWMLGLFADGLGVPEKSPLLVADVATDSNTSRVLHEGTGHFNPIIVIYTPPSAEPIAGIGYVFSHYEFVETNWNRLTDQEWELRLLQDPPPRPPWAASFLPLGQQYSRYFPWVAKSAP